jgi:hypothetical protein
MTIREAKDTLVTHARPACHPKQPLRCVAVDPIFAKPALSDAEGEPGVGQSVARRIGGMEAS